MTGKRVVLGFMAAAATLLALGATDAGAAKAGAGFKVADCYGCHDTIEKLHAGNKHAKVGCEKCHDGIDKHLADEKARPVTKMGPEVCGGLPQGAVRELPRDVVPPPRARREEPAHGPLAEPLLGQADDGARLHEGAQH